MQFAIGCTEPYALQTNDFENLIVVEASITNELSTQEIKLSRTYRLEQFVPEKETGAEVYITDNLGNRFDFDETDGKYFSSAPFQANPGVSYTLYINTNDGSRYVSNNQQLTAVSTIESVTTNVERKEGVRGVQISINSTDATNNAKYYRYTYEETNKVTVPKWNGFDAYLSEARPFILGEYKKIAFVLRDGESKTCYTTKNSTDLILANTIESNNDKIVNFPIRFISDQDYTIAERYSIKIKQHVQNAESYKFYSTLQKLSSAGSLLSQFQPGLLVGNIKSTLNPNEKVIGFFEVSSVSEKRIFFNFQDIFQNQETPPYFNVCKEVQFESDDFLDFNADGDAREGIQLRNVISGQILKYYKNEANVFYMVEPICGDCTTFSSNIKPAFWID